jgi:D-alanyl-D-alanine carboxypeptidase
VAVSVVADVIDPTVVVMFPAEATIFPRVETIPVPAVIVVPATIDVPATKVVVVVRDPGAVIAAGNVNVTVDPAPAVVI